MTIAVIALGVVVALLLVDRWQQRRAADPNVLALISLADRLCQRLQAPNAAVLEHDEQVRGRSDEYAPPAVIPDDDEAYWMSREKLAAMMLPEDPDGRTG